MVVGQWHNVNISRSGDSFTLIVTKQDGTQTTASQTQVGVSIDIASDLWLLARDVSGAFRYSDGSIANFRITTGGVTKTLVPEDSGDNIWIMGSDGSATLVENAIQGTLTSVHGDAPLATEDWLLKYGGSRRTYFDGVNDCFTKSIANYRSGDNSGRIEFTFSSSSNSQIAAFSTGDVASAFERFFWVGLATSGKVAVSSRIATGTDNIISTVAAFNDGEMHTVIIESTGSAYTITVDGVTQALSIDAGSNDGRWFSDISSRDAISIGSLLRSTSALFWNGVLSNVKIYDSSGTLVNHWQGFGADDWTDIAGSDDLTSSGSPSTVYIPNKTDGTSALTGLTPDASPGELLTGRGIDFRGGVDSAFAQAANLETEYRYGDGRTSPNSVTVDGDIEKEFYSTNP